VIIPPNYEHLIINASDKDLTTANWVCREFSSNIYEPFREKRGFGWLALADSKKEVAWVKNQNYSSVPELKHFQTDPWLNRLKIGKTDDIYQLIKDLTGLNFLKHPDQYDWSI